MIYTAFVAPPPGLVTFLLGKAGGRGRRKTSARGAAWRSHNQELPNTAALHAAALLQGAAGVRAELIRVQWWAHVLYSGAAHEAHDHPGQWSFIHHLTDGAPTFFVGEVRSCPAKVGQLLVFPAKKRHGTSAVGSDEPRVTIAGNLWFGDAKK